MVISVESRFFVSGWVRCVLNVYIQLFTVGTLGFLCTDVLHTRMDDNGSSDKDVHLTVRVSNRLDREIDEWSERRGYSRSEAARKLLKQGLDYEDKIGEIEERIQALENDVQQNANRISKF